MNIFVNVVMSKFVLFLIVLLMVFKLYYVIQNKNKLWKLPKL
mgnify:CR=1 FL=1